MQHASDRFRSRDFRDRNRPNAYRGGSRLPFPDHAERYSEPKWVTDRAEPESQREARKYLFDAHNVARAAFGRTARGKNAFD